MNTAQHIGINTSKEWKVQLKGAYEGNYRVLEFGTETFVFTDTKKPLQIYNQDIIGLVTEVILKNN